MSTKEKSKEEKEEYSCNDLVSVSEKIEEEFQKLKECVTNQELLFEELFKFELNKTEEQLNKIIEDAVAKKKGDKKDLSGIYFFEIEKDGKDDIETWLENFQKDWKDDKKNSKMPPFNDKRKKKYLKKSSKNQKHIPLYIGKAEALQKRFENHITLKKESGTYAMKLIHHAKLKDHRFRVHVLQIPLESYKQISACLESAFREKHNPIVGKK